MIYSNLAPWMALKTEAQTRNASFLGAVLCGVFKTYKTAPTIFSFCVTYSPRVLEQNSLSNRKVATHAELVSAFQSRLLSPAATDSAK